MQHESLPAILDCTVTTVDCEKRQETRMNLAVIDRPLNKLALRAKPPATKAMRRPLPANKPFPGPPGPPPPAALSCLAILLKAS